MYVCLHIILHLFSHSPLYLLGMPLVARVQKGLKETFGHLIWVSYLLSLLIKPNMIIDKERWEHIEAPDGPSPRYGHAVSLAPDQQSMFIIGGYNNVTHFDDIYQFHFGAY